MVEAVLLERFNFCSGCGTDKRMWEEDPLALIAVSETCPGCEAIKQEEDNIPDGAKGVKILLVTPEEAEKYMPSDDEPEDDEPEDQEEV